MHAKLLSLSLLGALALTLVAGPVQARDDEVRRHGSCSGGPSEWKLRVRSETGTSLRVMFVIEESAAGQEWQLFLSDDGTRIYAGSKVSNDEGKVRVRKITTDRDGSDRIKASGVNVVTGESCSGSLTY